ncbi:MAG: hypothetical protein GY847_36040 [Proteobacteria bacterium]|nr:hypothetical protein [Pseudomonadota bacterium]
MLNKYRRVFETALFSTVAFIFMACPRAPENDLEKDPDTEETDDSSNDSRCREDEVPQWKTVSVGFEVDFVGIWGASDDDVFAVTRNGRIFHFDGKQWSLVDVDTGCSFEDIEGRSSSEIYAVGGSYGSGNRVCAFEFDGTKWTDMQPDRNGDIDNISIAENGFYAVGRNAGRDILLWYENGNWTKIPIDTELRDVYAINKNDAYFISYDMDNCEEVQVEDHEHLNCDEYGVVLHYNGDKFETIIREKNLFFEALHGINNEIYIVGTKYNFDDEREDEKSVLTILNSEGFSFKNFGGREIDIESLWAYSPTGVVFSGREGYVFHYNGSDITSMNTDADTSIKTVFALSSDSIFAGSYNGKVSHYGCGVDGIIDLETEPECHFEEMFDEEIMNEIQDFYVDDSGLFLAGTEGLGYVQKGDDNLDILWSSDDRMQSVLGFNDNRVFATGGNSEFITCDGFDCNEIDHDIDAVLSSLFGFSSTDLFVMGQTESINSKGVVSYFDGSVLTKFDKEFDTPIVDAWGVSKDNMFFLSSNWESGKIFSYNNDSFKEIYTNNSVQLKAIWGSSDDDIYVVGEPTQSSEEYNGIVLHFDGSNWLEVYISDNTSFHDVWGTDSGNIYITGTRNKEIEDGPENIAFYFNGTDWKEKFICGWSISKITGDNDGNVYVLDAEGGVLKLIPHG